jgi:hypothetical protein
MAGSARRRQRQRNAKNTSWRDCDYPPRRFFLLGGFVFGSWIDLRRRRLRGTAFCPRQRLPSCLLQSAGGTCPTVVWTCLFCSSCRRLHIVSMLRIFATARFFWRR